MSVFEANAAELEKLRKKAKKDCSKGSHPERKNIDNDACWFSVFNCAPYVIVGLRSTPREC
jgi:hypothetical protein